MSQTKAQLLDSAYESGAVLTGSTNNTITTVTGAKAIQGEANLTFDGDLLSLNKRAVVGNDYPILWLNSGASFVDNAGAGVITFSIKDGAGNYCNTAEIRSFIDGTPGNNDSPGDLSFRVTADGSSQPTERMKIDSSGRVTTPSQPCSMYASLSNSSTNGATDSTETLVFHNAKRDEGSHYNNSNGRFTAPVAGTYLVGHNCLIDNNAGDVARSADLQKNGSGYVTLWYDESGGDNDYHGVSGTAIIELAANDYISIRATAGIHDGAETNFFAYLLG